uniref:Thyroid hormone receptor-associated protein complex subunit n=1 Tax=Globodera pallida TaxID=36090 RepID=A0A183CAG1_GLOPA
MNQLPEPSRVSSKLVQKLSVSAPSKLLVEKYLITIAQSAGIDFVPDAKVMREDDDEIARAERNLINFMNEEQYGWTVRPNDANSGGAGTGAAGGGKGGGGSGGVGISADLLNSNSTPMTDGDGIGKTAPMPPTFVPNAASSPPPEYAPPPPTHGGVYQQQQQQPPTAGQQNNYGGITGGGMYPMAHPPPPAASPSPYPNAAMHQQQYHHHTQQQQHMDKFVKLMSTFVFTELNSQDAKLWVPHCRQVVNVIYGACHRPNRVFKDLFDSMVGKTKKCLDELRPQMHAGDRNDQQQQQSPTLGSQVEEMTTTASPTNSECRRAELELVISRLLFFVGELVLKFLSYAESSFCVHIRDTILRQGRKSATATPNRPPSRHSVREKNAENGGRAEDGHDDDDDGLGQEISEEEKNQMCLQRVLDKDTFAQDTIIGRTVPVLMAVLENHINWSNVVVESALLCLSKFMLVNARCCKTFLSTFFSFFDAATRSAAAENVGCGRGKRRVVHVEAEDDQIVQFWHKQDRRGKLVKVIIVVEREWT